MNYNILIFFFSCETIADMHELVTKPWSCIFKFRRFWYLNLFRQLCISFFLAVSLLEMLCVRFLYAIVLSVKLNPPSWRNATFIITNLFRARKHRSLHCWVVFLLIRAVFNCSFSTVYFVQQVVSFGLTDGQADMTKLIVAFRSFENASTSNKIKLNNSVIK
jgi:hypothetical protein